MPQDLYSSIYAYVVYSRYHAPVVSLLLDRSSKFKSTWIDLTNRLLKPFGHPLSRYCIKFCLAISFSFNYIIIVV